jgi:hypothetical protein
MMHPSETGLVEHLRKKSNKHMSLYMEEVIFVANQEASGRRDQAWN